MTKGALAGGPLVPRTFLLTLTLLLWSRTSWGISVQAAAAPGKEEVAAAGIMRLVFIDRLPLASTTTGKRQLCPQNPQLPGNSTAAQLPTKHLPFLLCTKPRFLLDCTLSYREL